MKKHHTTAALLVLFFTGIVVLWWADFADIETNADRAKSSQFVLPELMDLNEFAIQKLEIDDGKQKVVFDRRGRQRWQMLKPIDTAADAAMIEANLRSLKELRKSRDSGEIKGDAKSFGLDKPAATVSPFGSDADKPLAVLDVGVALKEYKISSCRAESDGVTDRSSSSTADAERVRQNRRMA